MLFSQLIKSLKEGDGGFLEYHVSNDIDIHSGASVEKANANNISFLESGSYLTQSLNKSEAGSILLPNNPELISLANEKGLNWATFENPRLAFAECLDLLNPRDKPISGVHPTAVIGENVDIGLDVSIGPRVCIGDNCHIDSGTIIHPGVVIYEKVLIGSNCELHANCVIHRQSSIGENCVIHSNSVIGSEGFGFIPTAKGWRKMPQTGLVRIENDVEIGCGSTVDRPAVGETVIGAGTKIDNLVQIGHGVTTGRGCAMASQVGIAGGAKLGDGVILAGQVGVGNRVSVGNRVIASSKCGIHADVSSDNVVSGFPAMSNKLWLRCSANFKKLPEIAKAIKELSRQNID